MKKYIKLAKQNINYLNHEKQLYNAKIQYINIRNYISKNKRQLFLFEFNDCFILENETDKFIISKKISDNTDILAIFNLFV